MDSRIFLGVDGQLWRVWYTAPTTPAAIGESFRAGWLTFASPTARRRLAPAPQGWSTASVEELQAHCERASHARITIDSVVIALDSPAPHAQTRELTT